MWIHGNWKRIKLVCNFYYFLIWLVIVIISIGSLIQLMRLVFAFGDLVRMLLQNVETQFTDTDIISLCFAEAVMSFAVRMATFGQPPSTMSAVTVRGIHNRHMKLWKSQVQLDWGKFFYRSSRRIAVCSNNPTPWEPPSVAYAPIKDTDEKFLKGATSIFDTLTSDEATDASLTTEGKKEGEVSQKNMPFRYFRWPMWLLGPGMLLVTGMVPTLWLPLSSVFLGPNIASLLSLTGLDCIFNLGACLFLLMADSSARYAKNTTQASTSKPLFSYQFWNMVANVTGFIIPLAVLFGSQKGFLQPQLPFISFAVLLGPYLLLLSIQILTEMLTWHWQSPVWLVTPVVYEAYRLLQMMRGLKLGAELIAPSWMMHTIRGLVCWWIVVLGVQLMRVAWFAGFTARTNQQQSSSSS